MNVAFVCFYEAWPPMSGAAMVTYQVVRHSVGRKKLIQLGKFRNEIFADDISVTTLKGATDNSLAKIIGLLPRLIAIRSCLKRYAPDVVVLEGASWVLYHLLLVWLIRLSGCKSRIIYHAHNVEYVLRGQKCGFLVIKLTRWAEQRLLDAVDERFAVSEVDRDQFEALYGHRPRILANGVDIGFFGVPETAVSEYRKKHNLGRFALAFMGSYKYKPNKEGIDFLVHRVMPRLVRLWPHVQLVCAGGLVPFERPWLISLGLIHHADIPLLLKSSSAGLAPIFSGSGTRLKILEYLAAGLPVVSTNKGAEGLLAVDKETIFYAESEEEFIEAIERILKHPDQSLQVGLRGMGIIVKHFAWPVVIKEFNDCLEGLG